MASASFRPLYRLSRSPLRSRKDVYKRQGGDSGFAERDALLPYLKNLDSRKYLVILSSYYNRPKNPPIPVLIRRL